MMKHEVIDDSTALAYLVDCTLATVQNMAMKKSRQKYEYERQIKIAQSGVDWMKQFDANLSLIRMGDIETTVADWAKKYEV